VKIEVGREYKSRRGERVKVTAIEPQGLWSVHYVVLSGPYKGVGARDGSRLTRDGRARLRPDGTSPDHLNDLVEEYVETAGAGDDTKDLARFVREK
jgi:hypothetical protein